MHLRLLRARLEAGRLLEQGVLADLRGEKSTDLLKSAFGKMKEARAEMDNLFGKLDELRAIARRGQVLPEYEAALRRILEDHPPLERVSLTDARFSNVAHGRQPTLNLRPIGSNLDEVIANIQEDLSLLRTQLGQTMDSFREALSVAEKGGFAVLVLSGRAGLPEKVMQSADLMLIFTQYYGRACMATIAADMQIYPRGLEWLKPPSKTWNEMGNPPGGTPE